jgi:hypothetical protein
MNLYWLASYPKSGNTWLRFFLYRYLIGEIKSSSDIAQKIPDIHRIQGVNTSFSGTYYCKTHFMYSPKHPYIDSTAGFIHIIRNPKDILLSSLNYREMETNAIGGDYDFTMDFINNMGLVEWKNVGFGNWVEHYESWVSANNYPHLLIRYEDMKANPENIFKSVIEFLGLELDETLLKTAIADTSFKSMKKLEIKERTRKEHSPIFSGVPKAVADQVQDKKHRFMNKGAVGQNLNSIGKDLDDVFNKKFSEVFKKAGY